MKNIVPRFLLALQLLAASCLAPLPAFAGSSKGFSYEQTCSAAGSSAQVLFGSRDTQGWLIANTSGTDIRVSFQVSESPALTGANSMVIRAGSSLSDSMPTVFQGRIVCASTTATPQVVGVVQVDR